MKSYISRKFPLDTRTTDQILVRRLEALSMGFHCGKDLLFLSLYVKGKQNYASTRSTMTLTPSGALAEALLLLVHLRSNRGSQVFSGGGTSDVRGPHVSLSQYIRNCGFDGVSRL